MRYFDFNKPSKKGSDLTKDEQQQVLSTYCHRYTRDYIPSWTKQGNYPMQFESDQDWLNNTLFQVTKTGKLSKGSISCYSTPTWPDGK